MKFLLSPVGSSGDVHPFVGLGLELQRRGHQVTFVTCGYFEDLVRGAGLDYLEFGTKQEFLEAIDHPDLWHPQRSFSRIINSGIGNKLREHYRLIEQHAGGGDTVVLASCLGIGPRLAQEKLGVPLITVHLQPAVLWSGYESPTLPGFSWHPLIPRWMRNAIFALGEKYVIDRAACPPTNAFRAELGLAPMRRTTRWWVSPECVLCLFPEWYAPPQPDWPANTVLTDFPLWDERGVTETPADLQAFLDDASPGRDAAPIVFTPGSAMRFGKPFFAAAADACRRLNRRGLLLSRFKEHIPAELPDGVRHFPYAPFSQVLPRAAAIVHHGGIGTTAQGFAAGIPQLIMPMAHDQPDNAARLKRLNVGDALKPAAFRGPALARKLQQLLATPSVAEACREIAARYANSSGLAQAADVAEKFAAKKIG